MKDILELLARACLATIFIFEARDSILNFGRTRRQMEAYGFSWNTDTLLYGACIFLILGSLLLLLGYRPKLGAWMLLCYLVPITFVAHDWWTISESPDRRTMSIVFMKDLAIIGGLLMVAVNGSGRFSMRRLLATTKVRSFI